MATYPAPKRIPQIFDPSDWDTAGTEEYLKLSGGTLTGTVNQRFGNFNLTGSGQAFNVTGGSYRINNTTVLSGNTLGSSIINSSLQSVGTLGSLNVSGTATAGNVTASQGALIANQTFRNFSKSLEIFQNHFSHICDITGSNAYGLDLTVAQSVSGASICKYYTVAMQFNSTGGAWRRLVPLSSSGTSSSRDWAVDILVSNSLTQLRLVRTDATGGVTGLAGFSCSLYIRNSVNQAIVADNATVGIDATNAGIYDNTMITQVDGRVGIGTDNPTFPLDVMGDINSSGNLRIEGSAVASTLQAVTGIPDSRVLTQGVYTSWNSVGTGAVDFVNKFGSGGDASFNFYTSSGNGSPFSTGKTLVGAITPQGVRVGPRWAVVAPSATTRLQTGFVVGTGASSGSVTFPEAFSSTPVVVSQMINLTTGRIFVLNIGSVNSSGFSWIKMYQQGGTTFNSGSEDFMWIAVGI